MPIEGHLELAEGLARAATWFRSDLTASSSFRCRVGSQLRYRKVPHAKVIFEFPPRNSDWAPSREPGRICGPSLLNSWHDPDAGARPTYLRYGEDTHVGPSRAPRIETVTPPGWMAQSGLCLPTFEVFCPYPVSWVASRWPLSGWKLYREAGTPIGEPLIDGKMVRDWAVAVLDIGEATGSDDGWLEYLVAAMDCADG